MKVLDDHLAKLSKYFLSKTTIDVNINPDGHVYIKDFATGKFDSGIVYSEAERSIIARLLADENKTVINKQQRSCSGSYVYSTQERMVKMRVQIMIPDIVSGTSIFFRLAQEKTLTLEDYVNKQIISQEVYDFLCSSIHSKKSIIIAGSTGSGKTTLLNAMIQKISSEDRLFIIEDTKEIACTLPNYVSVLTDDEYTYRKAVKDALRSSPDRIVVGEVRDGAALDLLKAWNTGHSGLASIHANSASSVADRLMRLCEEVVVHADISLVAEAVDLIIFIELQKGKVIIKEMLEPTGIENGRLLTKHIF